MGNELFKKITESTGLPTEIVKKKLETILTSKGIKPSDVTLEDLRSTLSDYLKEVIMEAKSAFENGLEIEEEVDPEKLGE